MLINGCLAMTQDINIVNNTLCSGGKVLLLSEQPNPAIMQSPNLIPATILLPSYECVAAELDGELEIAGAIYSEYLASKEPDMFICAIITALLDPATNILLYVGQDELNMSFINILIGYLMNEYGIIIGSSIDQFSYNIAYDAVILSKLYLYELINYEFLFTMYPAQVNIPEYIVPKLVHDMNPYLQVQTPEAYYCYFNDFKNRIKLNDNKFLINPIVKG